MRLRTRLIFALLIFTVSYSTKSLQATDLAPVMYTDQHPFGGLTTTYDLRAAGILNGEGVLGPYDIEPSRTEWIAQAPGYSIYLSGVYSLVGRSFFRVQLIQNALNSLSAILIFVIAGRVLSWRVGVVSGLLAALSHHLSHISNFILPDSLTALPLLAAIYAVVSTRRPSRNSYWIWALAGVMIGLAAWLRPQPILMGPFLVVMLAIISVRRRRWPVVKRAVVMTLVSFLVIAPITIRNYMVYGEFVPISIGTGLNLWEGIGDYSGDRFGAVARDEAVAEQEAALYDNPAYGESWTSPDGIRRDRDRVRKSLAIIVRHPIWYAGVMLTRMGEMMKYAAHAPLVFRSSPSQAQAPARREWRAIDSNPSSLAFANRISWMRLPARALQRITKETMLLFILIGAAIMFAASWRRSVFLLMVPFYYLLFQSTMHTEFRYALPIHYFLFVFAATVWVLLGASAWNRTEKIINRRRPALKRQPVGELIA